MLTTNYICDEIMRNREGYYIQNFIEFTDCYAILVVSKDEDTTGTYNWSMVPFITIDKISGEIIDDNVTMIDLPDETFKTLEIPKRYRKA